MRRWTWVAVLVVGIVLFESVRQVLLTTQNPNLVPALILLGATVAPATFVTFVLGRRLAYGISTGQVCLVAFVGGVVGVVTAGSLEFDTLRDLGVLPIFLVAVIEEAAKLIGPVAVLLFTKHREPADGLVVGVASGAGFAALETMGYAFVALVKSKGDIGEVDDILFLRGLLSPAAHMAWTGLTAAALWYAAGRHFSANAVFRFLGVYLVAVILHTVWDSAKSLPVYGVLSLISLGLLTVFAHRLPHRNDHGQLVTS